MRILPRRGVPLCIEHICTDRPAANLKKQKAKQDDSIKLHFGTMIPFKNHHTGLKDFSYAVTNYTSESVPKHFVEAVISAGDKGVNPHQSDIDAWKNYDAI